MVITFIIQHSSFSIPKMSQRRVQKVAEAIREVVSMAILAEIKDPRVRDVTVTFVEVSGDLRNAKVHVSVMGDETHQNLTLRGLQSAAGFLQAKLARELELRYTPKITLPARSRREAFDRNRQNPPRSIAARRTRRNAGRRSGKRRRIMKLVLGLRSWIDVAALPIPKT